MKKNESHVHMIREILVDFQHFIFTILTIVTMKMTTMINDLVYSADIMAPPLPIRQFTRFMRCMHQDNMQGSRTCYFQ